jgi:hypothetical protein
VAGIETARKLLDETLPSNTLMYLGNRGGQASLEIYAQTT